MKVIGVSVLILLSLIGITTFVDVVLQHADFDASLQKKLNPFYVMETAELIIFLFLLLSYLLVPLRSYIHNKRAAATGQKDKT